MGYLTILVLYVVSITAQEVCPLQGTPAPAPVPQALVFCTQYSGSSCCTVESDLELQGNFSKINAAFGNFGCAQNIKSLLCGWNCSPQTANFSNLLSNGVVGMLNVYVDSAFINGLWASCKGACSGFAGMTYSQVINGANGFIGELDSLHDPTYHPSLTHPSINYYVGPNPNPNGTLFQSAFVPPNGTDITGCGAVGGVESRHATIFSAICVALISIMALF